MGRRSTRFFSQLEKFMGYIIIPPGEEARWILDQLLLTAFCSRLFHLAYIPTYSGKFVILFSITGSSRSGGRASPKIGKILLHLTLKNAYVRLRRGIRLSLIPFIQTRTSRPQVRKIAAKLCGQQHAVRCSQQARFPSLYGQSLLQTRSIASCRACSSQQNHPTRPVRHARLLSQNSKVLKLCWVSGQAWLDFSHSPKYNNLSTGQQLPTQRNTGSIYNSRGIMSYTFDSISHSGG